MSGYEVFFVLLNVLYVLFQAFFVHALFVPVLHDAVVHEVLFALHLVFSVIQLLLFIAMRTLLVRRAKVLGDKFWCVNRVKRATEDLITELFVIVEEKLCKPSAPEIDSKSKAESSSVSKFREWLTLERAKLTAASNVFTTRVFIIGRQFVIENWEWIFLIFCMVTIMLQFAINASVLLTDIYRLVGALDGSAPVTAGSGLAGVAMFDSILFSVFMCGLLFFLQSSTAGSADAALSESVHDEFVRLSVVAAGVLPLNANTDNNVRLAIADIRKVVAAKEAEFVHYGLFMCWPIHDEAVINCFRTTPAIETCSFGDSFKSFRLYNSTQSVLECQRPVPVRDSSALAWKGWWQNMAFNDYKMFHDNGEKGTVDIKFQLGGSPTSFVVTLTRARKCLADQHSNSAVVTLSRSKSESKSKPLFGLVKFDNAESVHHVFVSDSPHAGKQWPAIEFLEEADAAPVPGIFVAQPRFAI